MVKSTDDKRVRRTKHAIQEALLRLIQEKPVARVTTVELCREADVNRNTFYAHYATPEDVLSEIEKDFLDELATMLDETYEDGEVTLAMCRAIDESRERWRSVWYGDPRLLDKALDLCCERALAHWDADGFTDADEGRMFLHFITRGASGVVGNWLSEGCRMPPEQLSELIDRFVLEGQRSITK